MQVENGQSSHAIPHQKALTYKARSRTFWEAAVGETVMCVLVPGDRNAVAVEKDGRIIAGHLPRKVSRIHALFPKIAWWNRSLHCDWKTVGKTTSRQAKVTDYSMYLICVIYRITSVQFFVVLIIH